jgi:hypothetical protein
MDTPIKIVSVKPLEDFKLQIEFQDGVRIVDLKTFELKGIFKALVKDENLFKTAHLDSDFGTVTWHGGLMLENDDLYEHGVSLKNSINVALLKKALSRVTGSK